MILGLGATAFAVVALTYLARTSREQRTIRAHDRVEAELERLADTAPTLNRIQRVRHGRRGLGELRSGYADDAASIDNPRLATLVREVEASGQTVIDQSVTQDGMPVVAGAARLEAGGYVWAIQRVVVGPEMGSLRAAVLCLAIAMVAMAFASVQTLVVLDRGAGALRGAVVALAKDLHAEVPRPKLRELAEVADGLDSLAHELSRAQEDKVRLMQELSEHERWAALGRVVAGVAHEVRNPLAAIKLRTDLAEANEEVPSLLREDFALIGSEVARLDRLVRDLLLLADRKPATRALADVADLVTQRAALLRPWAAERAVALETSGVGRAFIDGDAVTRAVDNLVRNAVEASPPGAVVTARVSDEGESVRVVVSDQGTGVPAENAALLFEPFFTTKPSGTGLGLALSRSVAEAHGGSLHHGRREGLTEFTLELAKG
jgi:signal transduction histidine kinase